MVREEMSTGGREGKGEKRLKLYSQEQQSRQEGRKLEESWKDRASHVTPRLASLRFRPEGCSGPSTARPLSL